VEYSCTVSLTSALDGVVVNSTSRPLYSRERDPVPIVQVVGGPSGRVRKISPKPGIDPWAVQPVASRYTDCALSDHTEG
jgi:hypothetical protein